MTLIKAGRLLHQYTVDVYTATEQERLRYLRFNQKKLRAALYNNVCDAVEKGDTDAKTIGTKVILPATFTGGQRYMAEKYHDAMAICRWYGNPHLFITVTTNPNWTEIAHHLKVYDGESANMRPDLECRAFELKLDAMMKDFKEGVFFPVLIWFQGPREESTTAMIDTLIPCMENGQCTKDYPRPYSEMTRIDESGFVRYKRREDASAFVEKSDIRLDNRYVIPHNLKLLDCHYVLACEASWRLFAFHIHHHRPTVIKLPLHLLFCEVGDPLKLWNHAWIYLSEDVLWPSCTVFMLTENMRLKAEDTDFTASILEVGNGVARTVETPTEPAVVYPDFLSSDSVAVEASPNENLSNQYDVEYLNSLEFPGIPNHRLCLKVNVPNLVFSHGQLYVALSRVTSPEGIKILDATSSL